jgi:hypothetical protein
LRVRGPNIVPADQGCKPRVHAYPHFQSAAWFPIPHPAAVTIRFR